MSSALVDSLSRSRRVVTASAADGSHVEKRWVTSPHGSISPTPRRKATTHASATTAYARAVVRGEILTGKLVQLACQRHLDMIRACKRGELPDQRWNVKEARAAVKFFSLLKQYKGRWAGQTLDLLPWQAFVIGCIFGWQQWSEDYNRWVRLYREAYVSVARKNGKTTLAGGLGLWLLDFDSENAAEVYFAATKKDQAKQGFDTAVKIVEQNRSLRGRIKYLKSVNKLLVQETSSLLMPLGRDSDTEHGLNVSGAVIDELHVHRNRDMVDAIDTATGAREQPLIFYITTAGVEGVSIYTETDDRARKVVQKISVDRHLFVYIATLDEEDDWQDYTTYIKANPSLGQTVQLSDLKAELDKAIATPGRQNSFKRLHLNMRTSSETMWVDILKWDAARVLSLKRQGKRLIGVDLGGRRDLSAAVAITWNDTGYDLEERYYMPEELLDEAEERDGVPYRAWAEEGWIELTPGDYRDDAKILESLTLLHKGAIEFDLDSWNSSNLTSPLQERGFQVVLIPQTFVQLTPAVILLEKAIAEGGISHLGNPVTRWMMTNTALEETRDGGRKPVKIDTKKVRRRIDGVSATLDALSRVVSAEPSAGEIVWGWGAS